MIIVAILLGGWGIEIEKGKLLTCFIFNVLPILSIMFESSSLPIQEKTHSCVSPLLSHYFTLHLGCFSTHQAILCNTSWVSYNSIQFGHCLPGVSIRSHKLRGQSQKTDFTSDINHNARLSPVLLTDWLYQGSPNLLFGFSNLLEWLVELR